VFAQLGPALRQVRRDLALGPFDDLFFLQDADVLQRHRRAHRMAGIGGAMRQLAALRL
jgi:hypothetical protein